ncbi:hypothetical protein HDU67_002923 [Dinochytrium kinnereticum]|nr:hypothetical protein HDU67_002923 [Dinochytrium kinnereticum]
MLLVIQEVWVDELGSPQTRPGQQLLVPEVSSGAHVFKVASLTEENLDLLEPIIDSHGVSYEGALVDAFETAGIEDPLVLQIGFRFFRALSPVAKAALKSHLDSPPGTDIF